MSDNESPTGAVDREPQVRARRRTPIERPVAPVAERLNRNALIVAACVLGMAALVAVVFLGPTKSTTAGGATTMSSAPPSAPPSFMDRPGPPAGDTMRTVIPPPIAGDSMRRSDPQFMSTGGDASIYRSTAFTASPMRTDADDDYHRALRSPLIVPETMDHTTAVGRPEASAAGEVPITIAGRPRLELGGSALAPLHNEPVTGVTVVAHRARGALLLVAGSVVSAVLVTALNSDLPGDIGAQVTRDVYDSPTQSVVLIPKGAKLVGHVASGVIHGQRRVALVWVRLNLPDGDVIDLPGQPAADEHGAAGIPADIDNHTFRTFSAAGIAATIGAGVELSQPQNGASVLTTPTVGQVLAGSLGQELGTVGLEVVRRELDVPPTLTLPPGALFNLLLTTDLVFRQPYGAVTP